MNQIPSKRKANFGGATEDDSRKMPKKMSFAERMMAKMGHKSGDGLGKSGDGMLNPIQVTLRPQGVGLGSVKEKSKQAKEEDKRQAKIRGVEYEDSSEEERKARKKRQQQKTAGFTSGNGSGASTPRRAGRPKVRYQTAADLEEAAEGLEIPNIFKDIIDATGQDRKLLTSGEGIFTSVHQGSDVVESDKIKSRARKEVEAFVDSWNHLKERQKDIELEESQYRPLAADWDEKIEATEALLEAIQSLAKLQINSMDTEDQQWEHLTTTLEDLNTNFGNEPDTELDTAAVATIQPLFKRTMADWHPLEEPTRITAYLSRLQPILSAKSIEEAPEQQNGNRQRSITASPYESLIHATWLPKLRSAITNNWNPYEPNNLISLFEAWKPLLPDFIADSVVNSLIVQKLVGALQSWNPRTAMKKNSSKYPLPHIWIFPWLPYLSFYHTDPSSATGLLSDVNRKLRVAMDSWDISKGIMPGLTEWSPLLGNTLQHTLVKHILPRLATYMTEAFEVDPADQDLTPLENVLLWKPLLPLPATAQLLVAEFFPKLLSLLHAWITGDEPSFDEIQVWYSWWKEVIPFDLNELLTVRECWLKGNTMISDAFDMQATGQSLSSLLPPAAGPARPLTASKPAVSLPEPTTAAIEIEEPIQMRTLVEDWCEDNNLLLIPLREANVENGLPLFRMTASATGKGGIIVWMQGMAIYGQQRKGDRSNWVKIPLGDELIARAEAR